MEYNKKTNPKCKDCIAKDKCNAEFGDGRCIAIRMTECYNKSQRDFARELSKLGELLSKKYPKEIEELNKKCHEIDSWRTVMDIKK